MLKDPVCGKRIHRGRAHIHIEYDHITYYLCCPLCQSEFEARPEKYARPEFGERLAAPANRQPARNRH